MSKSICIIGALKDEVAAIKGQMLIEDSVRLGSTHALKGSWHGQPLILLRSGMGKHRARDALFQAQDRFPLSIVISIGFAGGVRPGLREGDLVFADTVFDSCAASENLPSRQPLPALDKTLVDRAMMLCPNIQSHRGGLLTVDKAVCKPEEKRALGNRYPILAVDMETAGLLPVAMENHLPFLSVRAVTDTVDQELVNFSSYVDETGEVSKLKAGWHILTHPATIPKIRDLRDHCRTATFNLTYFVAEFLRLA
ncbi:MAG: hypothetical protein VYC17_02700 [Nitrospinota bacterium]|nr:hypothetical protein [Nitrospinota bacterium]